jgi:prepilin-type processing-associated H-X9-DG protein
VWYLPWERNVGRPFKELAEWFDYCHFALNGYTCFPPDDWQLANWGTISYRKITEFKNPSTVIFAQDHVEQKMDGIGSDMFCASPGSNRNLTQWRGYSAQYPDLYPNSIAECFRHNRSRYEDYDPNKLFKGVSNTLWLDGHVDTIKETFGQDVPVSWYNPL